MHITVSLIVGLLCQGPGPQGAEEDGPGPAALDGYCMMGRVLVQGTEEPVRGATVRVAVGGNPGGLGGYEFRTATSDGDGAFVVHLPRGTARAWFLEPPPGYWTSASVPPETFSVSPDRRVQRQDYTVRRGTVWAFSLARGRDRLPIPSGMVAHNLMLGEAPSYFRKKVDDAGVALVTIPREEGRVTVVAQAGDIPGSELLVPLRWEAGFRPDSVTGVDRADGGDPSAPFRVTDRAGRSATVSGPVEPVVTDGRLVLRVIFPDPDPKAVGSLAGTVVDERGRPTAGAAVALVIYDGPTVAADTSQVYSDGQGRFDFLRVARHGVEGELRFTVLARKPGYGGGMPDAYSVELAPGDAPRIVGPIRLNLGLSLQGAVVDHNDRPIAGAWVEVENIRDGQLVKTDARGQFMLRDVTRGVVPIAVKAGGLSLRQRYVADGGSDEPMLIRLPGPVAAGPSPVAAAAPSPGAPARPGHPAPPLQVTGWTDGKSRSLSDYHGRVVVLDFWGIWCGPCVRKLPALEELHRKYEAKGVVFLGVHSPGEDLAQVRKFLGLKGVTFPSGVDEGGLNTHGTTVQRYGVAGLPTVVVVDRAGVISYSTDDPSSKDKLAEILAEHRLKAETVTADQLRRMDEILLEREVERLAGHR